MTAKKIELRLPNAKTVPARITYFMPNKNGGREESMKLHRRET